MYDDDGFVTFMSFLSGLIVGGLVVAFLVPEFVTKDQLVESGYAEYRVNKKHEREFRMYRFDTCKKR